MRAHAHDIRLRCVTSVSPCSSSAPLHVMLVRLLCVTSTRCHPAGQVHQRQENQQDSGRLDHGAQRNGCISSLHLDVNSFFLHTLQADSDRTPACMQSKRPCCVFFSVPQVKFISDKKTDKILGAWIMGPNAPAPDCALLIPSFPAGKVQPRICMHTILNIPDALHLVFALTAVGQV